MRVLTLLVTVVGGFILRSAPSYPDILYLESCPFAASVMNRQRCVSTELCKHLARGMRQSAIPRFISGDLTSTNFGSRPRIWSHLYRKTRGRCCLSLQLLDRGGMIKRSLAPSFVNRRTTTISGGVVCSNPVLTAGRGVFGSISFGKCILCLWRWASGIF